MTETEKEKPPPNLPQIGKIKNCETGEYLHIENLTGHVEHGEVPTT